MTDLPEPVPDRYAERYATAMQHLTDVHPCGAPLLTGSEQIAIAQAHAMLALAEAVEWIRAVLERGAR